MKSPNQLSPSGEKPTGWTRRLWVKVGSAAAVTAAFVKFGGDLDKWCDMKSAKHLGSFIEPCCKWAAEFVSHPSAQIGAAASISVVVGLHIRRRLAKLWIKMKDCYSLLGIWSYAHRNGWLAADQMMARKASPHMERALRTEPRMLSLDVTAFHQRLESLGVNLPRRMVLFYMRHPEMLPKSDLLDKMCEALFLPSEYHRNGYRYSDRLCCAERLKYYHVSRIGEATAETPCLSHPHTLQRKELSRARQLLQLLESERARQLGLKLENRK